MTLLLSSFLELVEGLRLRVGRKVELAFQLQVFFPLVALC